MDGKKGKAKYKQEVDTNVFQIQLNCLKEGGEIATGDPIICEKCSAIFNKHSKYEENKANEETVWTCEFCAFKNKVNIEPEEVPLTQEVNYVIEASA